MRVLTVVVVRSRAGGRAVPERAASPDAWDADDVCLPLHGEAVVVHAVRAVLALGLDPHVHVLAPPAVAPRVAAAVSGAPASVHTSVAELRRAPGTGEVGAGPWSASHPGQRREPIAGDAECTSRCGPGSPDVVLLHDAARPLVSPDVVRGVLDAVRSGYAAGVPVLPLPDTVKRVDGGLVGSTPDRATLRVVQTPQAVRGDLLEPASVAAFADPVTAWTVAGADVRTVPGDPSMFAVRHPWDAELAALLLAGPRP